MKKEGAGAIIVPALFLHKISEKEIRNVKRFAALSHSACMALTLATYGGAGTGNAPSDKEHIHGKKSQFDYFHL